MRRSSVRFISPAPCLSMKTAPLGGFLFFLRDMRITLRHGPGFPTAQALQFVRRSSGLTMPSCERMGQIIPPKILNPGPLQCIAPSLAVDLDDWIQFIDECMSWVIALKNTIKLIAASARKICAKGIFYCYLYPSGFPLCQRQASVHISASVCCARQPRRLCASIGSA